MHTQAISGSGCGWVGGVPKIHIFSVAQRLHKVPQRFISLAQTPLYNTYFIPAIFVSKPRLLENPSNLNDELSTKYTGYDTYDWYFLGNGSLHLNDQKEV